ncbi:MAG: hypothetical protein P8016_15650 [Sedimentisphaerales bacterium]
MNRNTYLGILGILSFIFGTIQLIIIISYPMLGYLIFKTTGGSYSVTQYKHNIPVGTYIITFVLFAIATTVTWIICISKDNSET